MSSTNTPPPGSAILYNYRQYKSLKDRPRAEGIVLFQADIGSRYPVDAVREVQPFRRQMEQ